MAPTIRLSIEGNSKATTGAGVTKRSSRRSGQKAIIPEHRLATPPAEELVLTPEMKEYLRRRFNPIKHRAIRDYFANLPGFDFPFNELYGPVNERDMIRLETMFRFPEGHRLFSETPDEVAALRAAGRLTKFLHVLTVCATNFVKRFYPARDSENVDDELFDYYYAVSEAINYHFRDHPDWQGAYSINADIPLIAFLVQFILLGRKRVDDIRPDESDLEIAAEQLADAFDKKTGRI